LLEWISDDQRRMRLSMQAEMAAQTSLKVGSEHKELIEYCVKVFASHFLPDYRVLYVDDSDGDRISDSERRTLAAAGISIGIADAMPDVLLCNDETDALWVVEAVTSDGEVDHHKVDQLTALARRSGYTKIS